MRMPPPPVPTFWRAWSSWALPDDEEKNNTRGEERIISKDGAPVTATVIPTNEELMIAQDTLSIVEENKNK